jgi:predicted house-cleaning noncanonical NTP pyrophosphatase (MazG superfamily)
MESYTLIDLVEEDLEKELEDEDEEVESKKKRRRLAEIIINFISKNDYQTEDETEILLSLFEYPTDKQAEELKQLATNIEPIALARDVVEDRIDDLTYQVNEQPVKSEISDEKTEQIIALKEIRDYLSTSSEVTSTVVTNEIIETIPKIVEPKSQLHDKQPYHQEKTSKKKPEVNKSVKKISKNETGQPNQIRSNKHPAGFESHTVLRPNEQKTLQPQSLASTRELIKKIYENPVQKVNPIEAKNLLEKPTSVMYENRFNNSHPTPPDIDSIRRLLDKNHFSRAEQGTIIEEILTGADPETVIEKHIQNILKSTPANIDKSNQPLHATSYNVDRSPARANLKPQDNSTKKADSNPYYNPRFLAILLVLIILIVIIFQVI